MSPDLPGRAHGAARHAGAAAAAVTAVDRLAVRWVLTMPEVCHLLGGIPAVRWEAWRRTPPEVLEDDIAARVVLLLGIAAALHVLHPAPLADTWVRRPNRNPLFGGRRPLDVLLDDGIPGMVAVLALLDGRVAGGA